MRNSLEALSAHPDSSIIGSGEPHAGHGVIFKALSSGNLPRVEMQSKKGGGEGRARFYEFHTSSVELTNLFPEGIPQGGDVSGVSGLDRFSAEPIEHRSPEKQRLDLIAGDLPEQRLASVGDYNILGGKTSSISGVKHDGSKTRRNEEVTGK